MALNLSQLDNASRLIVEAELKVATGGGGRFQPTGFPDLGPALYKGADGNNWLLIESPQSMANRMERVCWVDGDSETDQVGRYNDDCHGIPFVLAVDADGRPLTASTLEAHRISSPYIWDTRPFDDPDKAGETITLSGYLKRQFALAENRIVPWKRVAEGLLKVDPGCLLHGIWFNDAAFSGGKVRVTRALSGYIEAKDPSAANYGFQKRDAVSDRTDKESGQSAAEGYGSVIGPKQHFTSPEIKAFFQFDLERLRSYGLSNEQVRALAAWAIYKIRRVLLASRDGVADLRTECKFEVCRHKQPVTQKVATQAVNGSVATEKEAIAAWLINAKTGDPEFFEFPRSTDDLIHEFDVIKSRKGKEPLKVKWIPNIEGMGELPEDFNQAKLKRSGLEGKSRVETPVPKKGAKKQDKPKRNFVIFGEWSAADKASLIEQNPDEPENSIVKKAIKNYETKWEAKAQSRKPEKEEDNEGDGDRE